MQWNEIEAKWDQMKGHARRKWAELTDDDLEHVRGNREKLVGKLQERYGLKKEEAQRKVDGWVDEL